MSLASSSPGLELDGSIGVFFITGSFALALWAVGCLQLYLYYEKCWKTELPWLKAYVFVIWILDTVHQALIMKYLYVLDLVNTVILAATIDAMVQVVFVRRVWYLSNKNFILTGLLSAAVLAQFTATVVYYGQIHKSISLAEIVGVNKTALAFNCISAVMDLGISCTLIWLLRRGRSGFERTDSVLNRLIAYTIGSGLVTEVMWIIAIIGLLAIPNTTVSLLVDPVIPKRWFFLFSNHISIINMTAI
ncbi:hypothetical protein A7U60_g1128 [Sanghuangporus baumii]|uniref:DUF6534 domain-containing protein n=1 Tax=Sanghuangporus baumii TaxID=108892 RepID=A0A9Q5I4Q7_SANBA|nr:hypothetical protein A7U60_g1128 [Sanghuangporus baumii]